MSYCDRADLFSNNDYSDLTEHHRQAEIETRRLNAQDVVNYRAEIAREKRNLDVLVAKRDKLRNEIEQLREINYWADCIKRLKDTHAKSLADLRALEENINCKIRIRHTLKDRECVFCGFCFDPQDALRCKRCFDVNFFDQNIFVKSESIEECCVCEKEDVRGIVWVTCKKHTVCLSCLKDLETAYAERYDNDDESLDGYDTPPEPESDFSYMVECPNCGQ